MPCCASVAAKFLPENHGKRRENGVERTSAMASAPASRSNAKKRSAGIFEWRMLDRSRAIAESLGEKLRQFHGRFHGWRRMEDDQQSLSSPFFCRFRRRYNVTRTT